MKKVFAFIICSIFIVAIIGKGLWLILPKVKPFDPSRNYGLFPNDYKYQKDSPEMTGICPTCKDKMKLRERQYYYRGWFGKGWVCIPCNSGWPYGHEPDIFEIAKTMRETKETEFDDSKSEEPKHVFSSQMPMNQIDNIPDRIILDPGFIVGSQNNIPRALITFGPDDRVTLDLKAIKEYLNEQRPNAHD